MFKVQSSTNLRNLPNLVTICPVDLTLIKQTFSLKVWMIVPISTLPLMYSFLKRTLSRQPSCFPWWSKQSGKLLISSTVQLALRMSICSAMVSWWARTSSLEAKRRSSILPIRWDLSEQFLIICSAKLTCWMSFSLTSVKYYTKTELLTCQLRAYVRQSSTNHAYLGSAG